MDRDHTEDDKEAQLRTLLEERSHPIIALDDDSDNEVTLDENTDPLGVQDSQVIVNQYGEPIYIDNPNAMLELLNLNNESGSVYIQQFGEPLNENGVIIDDNDGEPIYIDDSEPKKDYYIQGSGPEEVICIKDDADDAEEENTPICIEDSDDDSNSLTENKEPEKESEEKSKSIEDSDNEESSSPISDGSHKSDESHESDASESSDSSSDSSSSEESTDTESESDESSNDEQEPNKSSNKLKETLPEINMTSSESDSNEPQHKKLKKKKKKDNRDKQDFIQSKLNKWFLAEFESHMGLKLGESDDSPSISKPLEESDSEKSTSSSIRRNRYSDDSSSDESLGRWYSKTKWSSSDEDNEYDQTQEMQIEEGIEDEDSRNDNNEEYGSDTGARNFEGRWYTKQTNSKSSSMDMHKKYENTQEIKNKKGSEDANSVINNTVEYGSMPIITSPMPSMPFYEAESPQFQMMETPKPLDVIQSPKSEEATENKTDPRLDSENEEDLSDIETSSYFSSSQSSDDSDSEVIPKRKKKFTYWDDMSELPVDTGEISQEQLQGIFEDEEMLTRSERDSDSASDQSEDEESIKELDNDGYDFYEDPIPLQDNSESFSFMVIKDDNIFDEYEQSVLRLFTMVSKIPSQHRFEIHLMVYPMLAITYLQMVASDNMSRAIDFLENKSCQLDESYSFRLTKLADICRLEDIPNKARKQLAGYEKLELQMSRGAYRQLLFHLEEWPRGQQEKVLTHFGVLSYSEDEEPQQRPILGKQHLETLYWAAPEPIHQRDFTIRPLLRGRRRKWNESPQRKNINIPPSDRIYSPTIERMGLVRRKNDENHRVKLDRDNLPSAYLYSAPGTDNVVLCATFSEANTIIALGTLSSTIYVFSLKPTKLVQLKSASLLEKLDTGMAGIDKGMLDPLRKYTRRTLVGHQGPVYSCCFNPEDRYLLSSSEDHSVRLWCLLTWSCLVIYPGSLSPICHVIFAPRGYYFATASDDGMARIWAQDCRKPCRILEGHQAELTMCLFHPNRHYLATASADCTVRMWDVINGSQIRLFRGHKRRVSILTFSICGRYLVSGGDDNLIMIWDMPLGRLIRYLDYHTGHINTIEFCLDNNLLVVGGQDCRLSIWDFQRLLLDYEPAKVAKKESNNKDQLPFATQEELLINAYSTKNAPFYLIRFTRRNLLLAFCVTPEKSKMRNRHKIRPLDEDKRESRTWFDYLDTAKFEGICQSDFDLHFPGVDEKAQLKGKTKKNRSG